MPREAADQGHAQAQAYCGDLYVCGHRVAKDDRLAFVYYEKGAQQGQAECQSNLDNFYFQGRRGCEQNDERAAEWLKRAVKSAASMG